MSQIQPSTEWDESLPDGESLGCIGWTDEMSRCRRCRCGNIADRMVLQPVTLVACVVTDVVEMQSIKLH